MMLQHNCNFMPHRGKFQNPAIVHGLKVVHFRGLHPLGSLVASDDSRSLEGELTAEDVAWVCITVYLPLMTLSLDPLGFKTQRDCHRGVWSDYRLRRRGDQG
jgi:hypothetical protein